MCVIGEGGALTRRLISGGGRGTCVLCTVGVNNCGYRASAIRFGLRLAFLLRSGCCGNTAGEPTGGRGLESRKSAIVRAPVRGAIGTRFCWTP